LAHSGLTASNVEAVYSPGDSGDVGSATPGFRDKSAGAAGAVNAVHP